MGDSPGQVDVVLVLRHDGQQLVKCQDSHPLDVQVGDGGGKVTGADETEASKEGIITCLMWRGSSIVIIKTLCMNDSWRPHHVVLVISAN